MDSTENCARCKQPRDSRHMKGRKVCLFCRTDAAVKHLTRMEGLINFTPTNGHGIKAPCKRCRVLNWWVNINEHEHCIGCAAEIIAIEAELLKNPISPDAIDIDDVLEEVMAGMFKEEEA